MIGRHHSKRFEWRANQGPQPRSWGPMRLEMRLGHRNDPAEVVHDEQVAVTAVPAGSRGVCSAGLSKIQVDTGKCVSGGTQQGRQPVTGCLEPSCKKITGLLHIHV
jgi:hypothetical protein